MVILLQIESPALEPYWIDEVSKLGPRQGTILGGHAMPKLAQVWVQLFFTGPRPGSRSYESEFLTTKNKGLDLTVERSKGLYTSLYLIFFLSF